MPVIWKKVVLVQKPRLRLGVLALHLAQNEQELLK
jgi:hypothetical protein